MLPDIYLNTTERPGDHQTGLRFTRASNMSGVIDPNWMELNGEKIWKPSHFSNLFKRNNRKLQANKFKAVTSCTTLALCFATATSMQENDETTHSAVTGTDFESSRLFSTYYGISLNKHIRVESVISWNMVSTTVNHKAYILVLRCVSHCQK